MPRAQLPPKEFLDLIQERDYINSVEVSGDVSLTDRSSTSPQQRTLKDVVAQDLHYPDFSSSNLLFDSCKINLLDLSFGRFNVISICNCVIDTLVIKDHCESNKLEITNNTINKIRIENCKTGAIHLVDNDFAEINVSNVLDNTAVKIISTFDVKNQIQLNETDAPYSETNKSITLTGKVKDVTIANVHLQNVLLEKLTISKQLNLKHLRASKLSILESPINEITCEDMTIKTFIYDTKGGSLSFIGGIYNEMRFENQLSGISFESFSKNDKVDRCQVRTLDVSKTKTIGLFKIIDTDIETLNVSKVVINDLKFDSISISHLFSVEGTTINQGKFHNMDLTAACIKFLKSTLIDNEAVNVRWPKGYKFYEYNAERKKLPIYERLVLLWALKESYRQMKVLSLAQHNKIDALYFQKQELNTFWNITKLKAVHESVLSNIGNWAILGSNKLFSDFGQNIWRPLLFLFGFHLLWFNLLLVCKFDIYPSMQDIEPTTTRNALDAFFITLLPTHGLDLEIGAVNQNIGGWIDFFMRITSGYFIFYFVYSSRKYHQ